LCRHGLSSIGGTDGIIFSGFLSVHFGSLSFGLSGLFGVSCFLSSGFFPKTLSLNVLKNNGTGMTNLSRRVPQVHGLFKTKSAFTTLSATLCIHLPTMS